MSVKILIPSYLQPYAGDQETVETSGKTVGECLNNLVVKFPPMEKMLFTGNGQLHAYVGIYLNGEDTYPEQLAKPVNDGDELSVLYIIGGG